MRSCTSLEWCASKYEAESSDEPVGVQNNQDNENKNKSNKKHCSSNTQLPAIYFPLLVSFASWSPSGPPMAAVVAKKHNTTGWTSFCLHFSPLQTQKEPQKSACWRCLGPPSTLEGDENKRADPNAGWGCCRWPPVRCMCPSWHHRVQTPRHRSVSANTFWKVEQL